MRFSVYILSLILAIISSCGPSVEKTTVQASDTVAVKDIIVGGGCDGCELMYEGMPPKEQLSSYTKINPETEPGEPMEISGVIYKPDGKTPAQGIILYIYHTDAKGIYSPAPGQTDGKNNGHLRGWMITNDKGEFNFTSIRPAPYPNADVPAHIHPVIKEPGKKEYYIDEFVFEDDPKLTPEKFNKLENRGGSGVIRLFKNSNGVWVGHREIVLGLNIPDYK